MSLTFKEIKDEIEKLVPKGVDYSVDLEAGNIALVTSDYETFGGGDGLIGKIAKKVKRKIVIRPPLESITSQEKTLDIINEVIPKEAGIGDVYFDQCSREIIIQCDQPGDAVGRKGANIKEIRDKTGWSVMVERKPPLFSKTVHDVREYRNHHSDERKKLLKEFGLNIHRPTRTGATWARITALGSYREVGRACHLVTTNESRIMIDVGVNIASDTDPMPYFTAPEALPLEKLDAVVLTHSHLDHAGMLPVLFKYGSVSYTHLTLPTNREV